ncbi:TIGR03663 family protein [bacterium]|nr:TIGR03663 family protein [bacterium]
MSRCRHDFWFYASVCVLALLAIGPRFVVLEERPLHHDEAQHAWYGYSFMLDGHYTHSPILHGPSLIILTGLWYRLFGDSIGMGRAMVALFSLIAMVAAAALWPRRYRWWLFPLIVTSPYLLYYSRFLRNELIFCAFVLVGLLGFAKSTQGGSLGKRGAWGMLATAPIVALLAFKENAIFVMATGLTFGVVWLLKRCFWRRPAFILRTETKPRKRRKTISARLPFRPLTPETIVTLIGWFGGILIGIGYVILIYGKTTADGTFSPLQNINSSIQYWAGQQSEHRISGKLHYHLVIMLIYELPILLMLLAGLIIDAIRKPARANVYLVSIAVWLAFWFFWNWLGKLPGILGSFEQFLHIEPNVSMMIIGLWIVPLLAWSVMALKEHWVLGAFMGWWAACSIFQYSVAGEKVPWLGVHIILPIYMALGWVWAPILRRSGFALKLVAALAMVLATVIAARNDYYLVGPRAADPVERMVYNHTTVEYDHMCREFLRRWERLDSLKPVAERQVALVEELGWPGSWYFRHAGYQLPNTPPTDLKDQDLVMGTTSIMQPLCARIDKTKWRCTQMSLRDHWSPEWPDSPTDAIGVVQKPQRSRLQAWWRYYWFREIWGEKGHFEITLIEPLFK